MSLAGLLKKWERQIEIIMAEKDKTKQAEVTEEVKAEEKKKKQKKEESKESKELESLKQEVERLNDKLSKEHDDYLRLMAEFETFRRRSAEERLSLISSASADTIKGMLGVLDDCESALKILDGSKDEAAKEGTNLIYNKLMDYLKTRGLERIEAKGEPFNTDFHEALTQIPAASEEMKDKVVDVIQTGYMFNGKVLRYAKVVVGA